MKSLAGLSAASLRLGTGANAFAQEAPPPTQEGPPDQAPAAPAPQEDQSQEQAQPQQAPTAEGQWVYSDPYGWVWVPAGATANTVYDDQQPYAYLYTPTYGWTWYASPWGFGPFVGRGFGRPFRGAPFHGAVVTPHGVVAPRVFVGPRVGPQFHGGGFHGGFDRSRGRRGFHGAAAGPMEVVAGFHGRRRWIPRRRRRRTPMRLAAPGPTRVGSAGRFHGLAKPDRGTTFRARWPRCSKMLPLGTLLPPVRLRTPSTELRWMSTGWCTASAGRLWQLHLATNAPYARPCNIREGLGAAPRTRRSIGGSLSSPSTRTT